MNPQSYEQLGKQTEKNELFHAEKFQLKNTRQDAGDIPQLVETLPSSIHETLYTPVISELKK